MRHPDIRIRVKLLSEAIWDSGEQAANHVHTQALSDPHGFVYYHAKTFKGQLKRQAIWLYRLYQEAGEEETASQFIEAVADLFGWGKEEAKTYRISHVEWRKGIMRLSHLSLPDNVKQKLVDFSPQDLLEAQTNVRAMIQLDNQIVKERMFRLFHTVKKGLMFEAKVEFYEKPELHHFKSLIRIVRSLDRIGAGVNRGRGKVEAGLCIDGHCVESLDELIDAYSSISEKWKQSELSTTTNHRQERYYVLEIYNEEPLKIGAIGGESNPSEASKQHIPGSTIRGAIISELIKRGIFASDEQGTLSPEDVDFLRHVHCQNGYLYKDKHLYIPTPRHLRVDKHQYREKKAVGERVDIFDIGQERERAGGKNELPHRYVSIEEDSFIAGSVKTSYRLHHSTIRNPDKRERENIYNYQAIAPGQTFHAIVYDRGQNGERLEKILSTHAQTWYLGGSRSAGYGRCRVKLIQQCDNYEQAATLPGLRVPRVTDGNVLTLTCLTDGLFRDAYGQPQAGISRETVEQWLLDMLPETQGNPIGVISHKVYLQTGMSEGYNSTWKARNPKETIVLAGSVMRYELTRSLLEDQWNRLILGVESTPHGSRTQEGFGWLRVNVSYPSKLNTRESRIKTTVNAEDYTGIAIEALSEEERKTYESIQDGLKQRRLTWLQEIANQLRESCKLHLNPDLKRGHIYRMLGRTQGWLKQHNNHNDWILQDFSDQPKSYSPYEKDTKQFALWDTHLEDVMAFLDGKEHERLKEKACDYLSSKGKFYYKGNEERVFIAELLAMGLYMISRERKEGSDE